MAPHDSSRFFAQAGLVALSFLFGWQALRTLMSLQAFLVRVRFDWGMGELAVFSLALFATSFLALAARRLLGPRRMLALSAGGLCLSRLGLQLWTGDPVGELVLTLAATVLFFFFLTTRVLDAHADGPRGLSAFAVGCWTGLVLDTVVHGACDTYDLSWRSGAAGAVLVTVLAAGQGWLWTLDLRDQEAWRSRAVSTSGSTAWTWVGFGAFLFLQVQIYQNVARLTALTGWSQPACFGWILASQALGLALLVAVLGPSRIPAAILALLVVANQAVPWWPGPAAALGVLAGQLVNGCWLALVVKGLGSPGRQRLGVFHATAMLVLLLFIFLYYSGYQVALPFDNVNVLRVAALVMALALLGAGREIGKGTGRLYAVPAGRRLAAAVLLLLTVPLYKALAAGSAETTTAGLPIQVMTYNVQLGFDMRGQLGVEELARTIAEQDPDVVCLQEVARGWLVGGSIDLVEWLSRRLGMSYVFGPAADPLMGNAVLTRLPVIDFEVRELPSDGLAVRRSFLSVRLDVGEVRPLEVVATHFQHTRIGSPYRVKQARTLVDFWRGRDRTVIAGDFNGEPHDEEIEILRRAGLRDAFAVGGGVEPGYTWSSVEPVRRIDYIWISPDLEASEVTVPPNQASDHLAVVAKVSVKYD